MARITATYLYRGPDQPLLTPAELHHEAGVITDIRAGAAIADSSPRTLLISALINAHDHARPSASSFGTMQMPLESWILRSILGTPPDPYLTAARGLARSARAGCAAMMVHYTRPSGTMPIVEEARAIARAAGDVGIRLAFALAVRDQNPIVYGDSTEVLAPLTPAQRELVRNLFERPAASPGDYIATVEEIAAAIGSPMVDVQFGPAGVQWCSHALLETIAEASSRTGRRVHMHLLETVYQRAWADQAFPNGIVPYLRDIGLLSDRLTLAHCTQARPDELDLIAEAGARIVSNFSSNLHLRSGLAPIAEAHRRGCQITIGVDGLALDEDDDALREARLVQMMHGGLGFQRTWTPREFLGQAVRNGRRATGAPGWGQLAAGEPADYIVINLDRLDGDAIVEVDPLDLLFARGNMGHIDEVVVAGRTIAKNGRVTGVDLPTVERELASRYRESMAAHADFLKAWPALEKQLAGWFATHAGCH
jgi:cytosine/adenosine deaminase-related metal-dependent hydrolase